MAFSERTFLAYLDKMNIITVLLPLSYHGGNSATFSIRMENLPRPLTILEKSQLETQMKYICLLDEEISFANTYQICDQHGGVTDLQIGAVIRTKAFDEMFYYDGRDLGAACCSDYTRFKLWAPTATQVKLKLRPPDGTYSEMIKMTRWNRGIWSLNIPRDLENYRYTFLLFINQEWREAVDPYVHAVTANGELGVIVKLSEMQKPKQALPPLESPIDAIIYETHIRDFSIHPDSGVNHKGLYLGAGEQDTVDSKGELTGVTYLKELGITHIEFMPVHDFAGVNELDRFKSYNWGYNPVHFNVPEGSYSTNPHDPCSRISELKSMIHSIHNSGLRVILDVVYNHVYIRETSSFEKIVPGYYFRHNEYGMPSNGTGVGNDLASERKMVRKFIVDSVRFWLENYQVDGFRFDLMGILDIDTMNDVRQVCDEYGGDILLIGEGWNLNTPLPQKQKAIIQNQANMPRIAQFNDRFRDFIKGSTFNLYDKGYALGNSFFYDEVIDVLTGSIGFRQRERHLFTEPVQTVNYVECHDNHTLWDKLLACSPDQSDDVRMKQHRLATGLVLLAQGIPFLHSGQEFFRTKNGESNSYRSPDAINQLDWNRKRQYKENVKYVQGLIRIRQSLSCFRMRTSKNIKEKIKILPLQAPLIALQYENSGSEFKQVILLINPLNKEVAAPIPQDKWFILADSDFVGISSNWSLEDSEIMLEPISIKILAKK